MTFYEKLDYALRKGLHVVVKDKDDEYCVFSPFRSVGGYWRDSGFWGSVEDAKSNIGSRNGFSQEFADELAQEYNWKIVEMFHTPFELYEAGDRVMYEGEEWEVTYVRENAIYNLRKESPMCVIHNVSQHELTPVFDEPEDMIEIDDKKWSKSTIKKALKNHAR